VETTVRHFVEAVAFWDSGYTNARTVVDAATELLVAGIGEGAVAVLAGTPSGVVDLEVPFLVEATLDEVGVEWQLADPVRNAIITTAVEARRYLAGELTARGLCATTHRRHGHDTHPLVEALSILDDSLDHVEFTGRADSSLVPEVDRAAAALIAGADRLLDGAKPDEL
jgi:hypothetical protein